jgi:hypothetical protein
MRKLRAIPLVAFAAVTAIAFAAPAVASATAGWTQKGSPIGGYRTLSLGGTVKFNALGAGIECGVNGEAKIWPSSEGEVTKFEINTKACTPFGRFKGCVVTSATAKTPWSLQAVGGEKPKISIGNFSYSLTTTSCEHPNKNSTYTMLSTTVTATPDNSSAISKLTLSGTGKMEYVYEGLLIKEPVTHEGELTVTPAGSYGIGELPTPTAHWTEEGVEIGSPKTIELNGTTKWTFLGGGYECTVHGNATLWPGNVGEISSFEINPSTCKFFGGTWSGCKATGAEATTPWNILAVTESGKKRFLISGFSYVLKLKECTSVPWRTGWEVVGKGNLTATPDSSIEMSELGLGGTVEGHEPGKASEQSAVAETWLNVTPAKKYGIG